MVTQSIGIHDVIRMPSSELCCDFESTGSCCVVDIIRRVQEGGLGGIWVLVWGK